VLLVRIIAKTQLGSKIYLFAYEGSATNETLAGGASLTTLDIEWAVRAGSRALSRDIGQGFSVRPSTMAGLWLAVEGCRRIGLRWYRAYDYAIRAMYVARRLLVYR